MFIIFFAWLFTVLQISRANTTVNYSMLNVSGVEVSSILDPLATVSVPGMKDNLPRMEWMARLFDHHAWKIEYLQNASHVCKEHIAEYLQGLEQEMYWASKMYDASGRYNGQFFFGNDFWLGSNTLCVELTNPDTNPTVPPFRVRFNIARIHLTLSDPDPPISRQLLVGLCLPSSCSPVELNTFLKFDSARSTSTVNNASIEVLNVRPVPGDYDILKDIKFYILGGVAITITLIVLTATIYESFIISKNRKRTDEEMQNTTNNNNEIKTTEIASNIIDKKIKKKTKGIDKGLPSKLLLSFSALSNGKKILDVENLSKDSIKCVHGLRFMSIAWVILVHTYLEVFSIAENKTLRILTERYFVYQTISNATFSVDTFFFISGLLVTIVYFRTAKKKQSSEEQQLNMSRVMTLNTKRFLLLVFYRLLRLTPAYLFVLGIHEVSIRYLQNSSVFEPNVYDHVTCDKYWWRNALYINTWYPQKEICMLWSWYMSNDTQFYIFAVIILLIAVRSDRHLKVAASIVIGFLLTSWVTTFMIAYQFDYHARIEEPFALFDQLYDKPWMRIGPYLVGMATGYLLFRLDCRLLLTRTTATLGWLLSIACLISLVYGVGSHGIKVPLSAFYASLGHTAWALSLAWVTVACSCNHGGVLDTVLSYRGWLPFSRLTYCAYLVHPTIMCITTFQMDGPIHLHNGLVLVIYFGNFLVAFMISFLISLGFEAPVVRLLKIIMGGRSKDD